MGVFLTYDKVVFALEPQDGMAYGDDEFGPGEILMVIGQGEFGGNVFGTFETQGVNCSIRFPFGGFVKFLYEVVRFIP